MGAPLPHPLFGVRVATTVAAEARPSLSAATATSLFFSLLSRVLGPCSNLAPGVPPCACQLSQDLPRLSTAGRRARGLRCKEVGGERKWPGQAGLAGMSFDPLGN